jgi:hypothetical protein
VAVQFICAQPFFLNRTANNYTDKVSIGYNQYDFYKETSDIGKFDFSGNEKLVKLNFSVLNQNVSVEFNDYNLRLTSLNYKSKLDFGLYTSKQSVSINSTFQFNSFELFSSFELNNSYSNLITDYQFQLKFKFGDMYLKSVSFGLKKEIYPVNLLAKYLDGNLNLKHFFGFTLMSFNLDFSPFKNHSISIDHSFSYPRSISSREKFSAEDESKTTIWKMSYHYNSNELPFMLTYLSNKMNSEVDLYDHTSTFSFITVPEFKLNSFQILSGLSQKGISFFDFYFNYTKLSGFCVGNLQSWPFASFFQSVIVNRINFKVNGGVEFWQVELRKSLYWNIFKFIPHLTYSNIKPKFEIESWQPYYLVFGVKDYNYSRLNIQTVHLGSLGFEVLLNLGRINLEIILEQSFPIYVKKQYEEEVPSPPITEPGISAKVKKDGGRWFMIRLINMF